MSAITDTRTYIVQLDARPDMNRAAAGATRVERKLSAANEMLASSTQAWQSAQRSLAGLTDAGVSVQLLPYVGAALVTAPRTMAAATVQALQGAQGVSGVWRDRTRRLELGTAVGPVIEGPPPADPYHVAKVRAPEAWAAGATGAKVVIGSIDTGVDMVHESLLGAYRGHRPDGAPMVDDHNWIDLVEPGGSPRDGREHGTHTAAIAVGRGPRGIGIAPQATLIAARAIGKVGTTKQSDLLAALNWMAAPTDSKGANADPTKAPDILTASWGYQDPANPFFRTAVQALSRQGILPVFAAGNSGPKPSTLAMPATYPEALSVAMTDVADKPGAVSSRGPGPFRAPDGTLVPKPDMSAPGVEILSAYARPGKHNLYLTMTGTSMATPNVAGVAALLLSKYDNLTVPQLWQALTSSTVDLGEPGHDTTFGAGRLDAVNALAAAARLVAPAPPPPAP